MCGSASEGQESPTEEMLDARRVPVRIFRVAKRDIMNSLKVPRYRRQYVEVVPIKKLFQAIVMIPDQ